eukprot:Nitzschia sp. Nitz4//scaffold50_size126154//34645//37065//NITZ4_003676-RA/size126154-processed-gene-0.166-mRNA-1//-1//CDS//3329553671//8893//frame0
MSRVGNTQVAGPVPHGLCYLVREGEQAVQGAEREGYSAPTAFIAISGPSISLCKLSRQGQPLFSSLRKGDIVRLNTNVSIQIEGPSKDKVGANLLSDAIGSFSKFWKAREETASAPIGGKAMSLYEPIATPIPSTIGCFGCFIHQIPQPLLSVVFEHIEMDQDAILDPLASSNWKRQLVGTYLLYSETFTTVIKLGNNSANPIFRVQAVTVQNPSRLQKNFFAVVLPSTRLVIRPREQPAVGSQTPTASPVASPVAKLLQDTIKAMEYAKDLPRTFLLSGPPGVGKTHSVQQVLDMSTKGSVCLVSVRGSELLATENPALALKWEFTRAAKQVQWTPQRVVSLIFLDEFDALISVDSVANMLAAMLDRMTLGEEGVQRRDFSRNPWQHGMLVVGATNRVDTIPAFLRRAGRFDREIPMSPPLPRERARILSNILSLSPDIAKQLTSGSAMTQEVERVADLCVGYVPADLNALVRRATLLFMMNDTDNTGESPVDFLEVAMSDVPASALRDAALVAPPKISWDDICGDPGGAKTALQQAIEWPRTKAAAFAQLGLSPPRGILLYGPPGCAKTTLARASAGTAGLAFVSLSPAEVYASSYVGEAEAIVRRAFSLARSAAPCLLFFDEIDAIFSGSGGLSGRSNSAEARVLSTFLNEMDGVDNNSGKDGVLVLGATNRPWTLDAALLRPGRLGDKILYIPQPDEMARRAILEHHFGDVTELDLSRMASDAMSGLMTGAELVGACERAKLEWLHQYATEHPSAELPTSQENKFSNMQEILERVLASVQPLLADSKQIQEFQAFAQSMVRT